MEVFLMFPIGITFIEIFKADRFSQKFSKFVSVFRHRIRPLIENI